MKEFNRIFHSPEEGGAAPSDPEYLAFKKEQSFKQAFSHRLESDPAFKALNDAGLIEQARKDFPAVADNLDVIAQISMKEFKKMEEAKKAEKPEQKPTSQKMEVPPKDVMGGDLPANPSSAPDAPPSDKIDWNNFDVSKLPENIGLAEKLALKIVFDHRVSRHTQIQGYGS